MEENNVITMETEENTEEIVETSEEKSGIGTGLAMLIGSGITLGAIALGKVGKKAYGKVKAKMDEKKKANESAEDAEEDEE